MTKTWNFDSKMYTRKEMLDCITHLQTDLGILSPSDGRALVAAVESGAIPLREACNLLNNAIEMNQVAAN
ncbi:MAG: hypothetical protein HC910_12905 [Spirulinaceae cyanobacterium SM2_1_0]|nr:hypothetical protein [Spirulinaceae cyanobacterium SM2_1_0]